MKNANNLTQKPVKRVLVCPLDWGLGHATRDVQIINELLSAGFEVIIGADNAPLSFLVQQFPELKCIRLPSFQITYPTNGSMVFKMLLSIPKILIGILKEHDQLKKIIKELKIDMVISDNRFGLWNSKTYSIFITNQLWIKTPLRIKIFERILNNINHWFIRKYNECWVPDYAGNFNLSAELSHFAKLPINIKYIGVLSRFKLQNNNKINIYEIDAKECVLNNCLLRCNTNFKSSLTRLSSGLKSALRLAPNYLKHIPKYDILVILSGPEPQRSIFENLLVHQISESKYKALFVLGKPAEKIDYESNNIKFNNHVSTEELEKLIIETPVVISRAGYSTIMDLVRVNKTGILVPTPGQTEQEYLAKIMFEKKWFYSVSQREFNLEIGIQALLEYKPGLIRDGQYLLQYHIKRIVNC